MKSPYTGGEVRLITEHQVVPFKQETFEMDVKTLECVDTGKRFTTGEMDDAFVDELHNLWRARHNMPTTEQLRAVREQLGLSLRQMSKLLGLGINQYRHYEAGELPTGSNLLLLRMLFNPVTLPQIIAMQAHLLPAKTIKALEKWIQGEHHTVSVSHTPLINEQSVREKPTLAAGSTRNSSTYYEGAGNTCIA
ncbi:type II toxin-antitoxin system MqsA family antitoxin [Botryobacter ruber]|uniref:type II toxin-antitoxin system MqsA family antitoxin n=1 Tax=Botryobacter ruber TaxID=2171629 RepID=UPI000E0ABC53|nr:type II toxin-antitoxin system MqsA family antitoxin [Botryobacter ruber]